MALADLPGLSDYGELILDELDLYSLLSFSLTSRENNRRVYDYILNSPIIVNIVTNPIFIYVSRSTEFIDEAGVSDLVKVILNSGMWLIYDTGLEKYLWRYLATYFLNQDNINDVYDRYASLSAIFDTMKRMYDADLPELNYARKLTKSEYMRVYTVLQKMTLRTYILSENRQYLLWIIQPLLTVYHKDILRNIIVNLLIRRT